MKFTTKDRVALLKIYGAREGYEGSIRFASDSLAKDYAQLERAADITTYELCDADGVNSIQPLTREEAIEKLGREVWLSGIVRSAFHWTAMRQTKDKQGYVFFNSKKLFQ